MTRNKIGTRRDAGMRTRDRAVRPPWWGHLATLMRLRGERANRPRRIDRLIDYFGDGGAQPARG